MLNRFLNQPDAREISKKDGISKADADMVAELLKSYTKQQLSSLSYKNRKDSLIVNIHAISPEDKLAVTQSNPSHHMHEAVLADWEQSEIEDTSSVSTQDTVISGTPVRAHMTGSVYLKPSPSEPDFISLGKAVHVGDVLCLLEAMKLFSEVKAPSTGTVSKIFVEHGSFIQEGDILFEITG